MDKSIDKTINQARQNNANNEINKILRESPLKEKTPKTPKKKPDLKKLLKNNYIKYGLGGVGILLLLSIVFLPTDCSCPVNNNTISDCQDNITFDSIKQQIIINGYAEITEADSTLKLTPYIE